MDKLKKYSPYAGGLAIMLGAGLWGLDGLWRSELQHLSSLTVVFLEHVAGLALAIPLLIYFRKKLTPLTSKQKVAVVSVSLLSSVLATYLFVQALFMVQFRDFSVVVLLIHLQAIFAIVAGRLLLKETLGKQFFALVAVSIIGALLVNFPDLKVNFDTGNQTVIAGLFAVGAAALWGTSTAISRYALQGTFWIQITALRFLAGTVLSGLALLIFPSNNALGAFVPAEDIQMFVIIALSSGFVGLSIYYFGLQRVRASRATLLELTTPIVALVVGYFKFNSTLSFTQWIGAMLILGSVFMVTRQEASKKAKKDSEKAKAIVKQSA